MKAIQAIDVGYRQTMGSEQGCQGEQPQWFGPEIIGSEIMDPGVDQKNMGWILFQGLYIKNIPYLFEIIAI